jgi:sugar lactone lactonase YvrE/enterochelin esterase-like enzyme
MRQAVLRSFLVLISASSFLLSPFAAGQESKPPALSIPKGEVSKHVFEGSKIFPGTTRQFWVYVPKQYDPAKPACLWVNQDGIQYNAPAVFDELIAKKEMPVTIGVFVTPGVVKATSKNALDRFNRSFEYDGLGDAYARFLLEELLPTVETLKTSDGRPIKLSKDGNDRAIAGASSGAICAFTVAWERPDSFRRVFSAIGTYVGLRGGNEYPTLIRKFEPKPIRIFLEDGTKDLNHWGGDWWMANQEMERAFIYTGYEVNHQWGTGGHSGQHATEIFPDAMRWLWKDWPTPIKAGAGSDILKQILIPGEGWTLVADGFKFTEGPAANAQGEVFFNDIPNSKCYKIGLDGKVSLFLAETGNANGQAVGPDGRLYAVATGKSQVLAYDATGKPTVVADGIRGNDLAIRHDGGIYVTHPGGTDNPNTVWFISPSGEKKIVDQGLKSPNGIVLSPDQSLLYVADYASHWVYSYVVQSDGSLADKQRFYWLHTPDTVDAAGLDGIKVDRDARLYVTSRMGIQICDQPGRVNAIIPTPNGKVANICFGGADFKTLFATCGESVYCRKLKVLGPRPNEAPFKPSAPRL